MAVTKRVFALCKDYFKENQKIAELGSQYVMEEEWGGYGPPYFKDVFSNLNITSFDINGENGAVKLNLSNDVSNNYWNQYDVVTNFGTTEHVKDQHTCWKNIFNMTKPGGIVISEIPKKENWKGHCKYFFDESTFESLSKDFKILDIQDVHYSGSGNLIYCVLEKIHSDSFKTTESEFMSTMEIIENYNDPQGY
jgi:hypothetical protein